MRKFKIQQQQIFNKKFMCIYMIIFVNTDVHSGNYQKIKLVTLVNITFIGIFNNLKIIVFSSKTINS